jgi:O-antigen ligase/polysaccharide polymerase Wzy-like membrane protein
VPQLLAVGVFIALAASEAGFYPSGSSRHHGLGWYPAALLFLILLVVTAVALGPPRGVPHAVKVCLGLLAAYACWSYLSIIWANQQGGAWNGANRTAAYVLVVALFALWPVRPEAGRVLLITLGLGLAGLGLIELLRVNASEHPLGYFIDVRFAEPAGYINANVALWTVGLWPCVWAAADRRTHFALRGLCLGGADLLGCLALMGQSRGWVFALPPAIVLFLVLTPGRLRLGLASLAVAGGVALAAGPILAVHDHFDRARIGQLVSDAAQATLTVAVALVAIGLLAALADRVARPSPRHTRALNIAAIAAVVVVAAGGAAAYVAKEGSPVPKLQDSWRTFKHGGGQPEAGQSRFSSAGTNRYDFWRVSWRLFLDEPFHGIGAENFQQDYLERGQSDEQPRYAHSLELGTLSQTGIVGGLLLGCGLAAGVLACLLPRRRLPLEARAVAGASLSIFAYWVLHASVDWFWEFPGLTAPSVAALGLAMAVSRPPAAATQAEPLPPVLRRVALAGAIAAGVALALSLTSPWLAEREFDHAAERGAADPEPAYRLLGRAEDLNALSPRPHLLAAAIALRVDDPARAKRELESVVRLEPRTTYALAELGAMASERGNRARAEELLRRAARYAPRNDVIAAALRRLERGRTLDSRSLSAAFAHGADVR